MAKIRVYELARELNLTNKVLIDKMSQLDIPVKSHMSSLEDETVAQVKGALLGKPADKVEETRIKPTVIRRRRKKIVEPAAIEVTEALVIEDAEPVAEAGEASVDKSEEETAAATAETIPEDVPRKPAPKPETPAKIVAKPPEKIVEDQKEDIPTEAVAAEPTQELAAEAASPQEDQETSKSENEEKAALAPEVVTPAAKPHR